MLFEHTIQGDTSGCGEPPVDTKEKVPFWPGQTRPGQSRPGQNGIVVLPSTGGLPQPDVSPCISGGMSNGGIYKFVSFQPAVAGDGFVVFGYFSATVFFSLVAFVVGSLVFLATVFVSSMIMSGSETASRELPQETDTNDVRKMSQVGTPNFRPPPPPVNLALVIQCCQMGDGSPPPSTLAQFKERKGSNFAVQRSGAMVHQARRTILKSCYHHLATMTGIHF